MAAALLLAGIWLWAAMPSGAALPPNVLVVGQIAEPKSLDPHVATALNDFRIAADLYDGLVRYRRGSLDLEPALAESWDISEDGKTYTFRLRQDVRFHDGTPFDAQAVTFNFERMLDESHPQHDTGPFPLARVFFDAIDKVEALDSHTVRFTLKRPFAPFLSNLAYPTGFMVSPKAARRYGKSFGRHPIGTGPFRFGRWDGGTRVVVDRNENYWDGAPALKAAVFVPIKDPNTRAAELLAGGIDVLVEVSADVLAIFRKQPHIDVLEETGPHLWFLILNTRHGPFHDKRMRQAVNYAIDKRALVAQVLQGSAAVAAGPIPSAFDWAYAMDVKPYPYDPERARALIKAAGYKGEPLTLYAAEGGSGMLQPVAMATAIQADLARVGLNVKVRTFEWNAFLAEVNDGLGSDSDMAEMAWMTNDPDTLPYLALRSGAMPEKGGFNSGYYSNPAADALIEEARRTVDREKRAALYRKLQRLVHEDAPWAFVASWRQGLAFSDRVKGLRVEPSFLLDLHGVSKPQ